MMRWFFVGLFFFMFFASNLDAKDPKDANAFLSSFETYETIAKKTKSRPLPAFEALRPPWAAYLLVPFEKGLSPINQTRATLMAHIGKCHELTTLLEEGFLTLYPHLNQVLHRQDIQKAFRERIMPVGSWPLVHCFALKKLKTILLSSNKQLTKNATTLTLNTLFERKKYGKWHDHYLALENLYKLSFCAQYPPAAADLIDIVAHDKTVALSPWQHEVMLRTLSDSIYKKSSKRFLSQDQEKKIRDPIAVEQFQCRKKDYNSYIFNLIQ